MESNEPESLDDSKGLETTSVVVEDMVAKYEDSEVAENDEDQSGGEQVYGYLYRSAGSEDATIYVDSRGFNLNGQSLIVTQNDDGNEIIVLVGEDPDGQPLDQTFAHSVLQSDEVTFEDGLKEHGTLVVDEHSQGLEFIKSSEEASEGHEERHMYIENSGEILNISNENVGSPVDIESPLWSVSNSGHLKNDGTEMLFIPNPTVVALAPEETKHRKLMQLACIAHELQSADQKSSSTVMCDYVKDPETSVTEYEEADDKVEQSDEEKNSADEEDKSLSSSERERCINFGSKPTKSTVLSGSSSSTRIVDNTVSVIHSTSSEMQGSSSLDNQTKLGSPPDFSSAKNFQNSESELPSEMLYSNVTFHDNLDTSPSAAKQLEESSRESLEENSQSLIPEVADNEQNLNLELNNNNDSPLTFIDKTHNLEVDHLSAEGNNVLDDASPDMKMDEDSRGASSAVLVIEDENPKSHDSDSNLSLMESRLSKAIDMSKRTSQDDTVPEDTVSDIDDDNISSTEHSVSVSENESSYLGSQYSIFNYKKKVLRQVLEKTPVLSPALEDDKPQVDSDPVDSNIKSLQIDEAKPDKNTRLNAYDFEQSPSENLESDLVIAEPAEERNPCEAEPVEDDYVFREDEPADVRRIHTKELVSTNRASSVRPHPDHKALDAAHQKQSNDEVHLQKTVPVHSNSSPDSHADDSVGPSFIKKAVKKTRIRSPREDDYSSSEETPLMKTKKTYLSFKKMKKSMLENKMNTTQEEKIVLYSDDINDCDNDKEVASRTHESRETSPSTPANNEELDESSLVSTVSVTRTYVNSVPKEKSLFRKKKLVKQSLRSHHSLRARSLPSTLPLNNGNSEVSDSDSKKNSFDPNNSDNIPWGKVLLETSFDQCTSPNDAPSTSFAPQFPKETSTPLLSPEQQRRKLNKAKRDFDRLLNSSPPIATKQPKISKKFSSRMHPNVIKATKSRYSNSHFSRLPKSNSLPLSASNSSSPAKSKKMQVKGGQKLKEAKIQILYQGSSESVEQSQSNNKPELYSCSSCNFSSIYVDNLMEHLKYCTSRQPIFDYEVNNMDKRQRIRGEEEIKDTVQSTLKKIKSDLRSGFLDEDPSVSQLGEDERDSDHVRKRKSLYRQYGYGDDDVVWVKFKDRFWPALVCSIEGLTAYVKLISYPKEVKGLKVKHENIRTFDNSKWNVLCLHEAQSLPHNDIFVKAVQSSERFMSKKFLGVRVTGKEFFSVRDEVDFATDSASSDSIVNEDSDSEIEIATEPARKARYERLDLSKIFDHLIKGKADDYVVDIFNKRKQSQKHIIFFDKQRNATLKSKPWFGPFEDKKQQNELFSHFRNLFTNKIGKRTYFVHYICQVMIPEAIVQAISVVKDIPIKDAELLFESEDSMDLENEDPSVEDILKKYS